VTRVIQVTPAPFPLALASDGNKHPPAGQVGMTSHVSAMTLRAPGEAHTHGCSDEETGRGKPGASTTIWRRTAFCGQSGPDVARVVLFQRSTWAVSPVSFPTALCWSSGITARIRFPEIGEAVTWTIRRGNGFPQPATGCLAAISDRVGHHLSRFAAQRNPDPRLVCFLQHKGPQLIQC